MIFPTVIYLLSTLLKEKEINKKLKKKQEVEECPNKTSPTFEEEEKTSERVRRSVFEIKKIEPTFAARNAVEISKARGTDSLKLSLYLSFSLSHLSFRR